MWGRIANAKTFGWAIYAAGFAVWLFGYLSAGHAPLFGWNATTPWWVSSFVPNFEAELGLALMYASMIPIYGGAVRKRAFAYTALLFFAARDPRVVVVFGVADLALDDLAIGAARSKEKASLVVRKTLMASAR